MPIRSVQEEYALVEKEIGGRRHVDFAENHACLTELFTCFDTWAESELLVYEKERFTYRDIARQAATLAQHLTDDHGVEPGSRVALALPNSPDWIIAFVAISAIGATPVLINARSADTELKHCLETTDCTLAFAERPLPVKLPAIGSRNTWPEVNRTLELSLTRRNGADEALLMFTSGTTGKPKAARLTHQGLMSALKTIAYSGAIIASRMAEKHGISYETLVAMRPPPVTLLTFPLFHVSGCQATFLSALSQGGKLVLMRRWDAIQALQLMADEKVTSFPGVPTMHRDILRSGQCHEHDLKALTNISVGGQGTSPALLEAICETFPSVIPGTGYGMTEYNGTVTLTIGESFVSNPKSAGRFVETAQGEIRDRKGKALPAGEIGEIHIRGPSLMAGYVNHDNSKVIDAEGWFATGDLGYLDDEGNLYIVDRRTDMVISGGENIYCAEVEQAVEQHPAIDECAALGEADERLGERLFVVARFMPDARVSKDALLAHCSNLLTRHKLPRDIYFTDEPLPRNASGKVIKPLLKKKFSNPDILANESCSD